MEPIVPISRAKSLKEKAYDKLKELIITGALEPGELQNEMRLAEALGVSRTPVREALLELSREGMVAFVPGKGVEVCKLTTEQVREVFEIRRIIEGHIIKEITTRLTDVDMQEIDRNISDQEKMLRNAERPAFIEYDKQFHLFLASKIGNRQIESILDNMRDQMHLMGIRAVEDDTRMKQVIDEHRAIFSALKEGDPQKAFNALMNHLKNTEKTIGQRIETQGKK
jgi:GntR family transcriptional regulator, rspAB operon transcriptional repressor